MKLSKDGKALMSLIATLRGVNCYRAHDSFYLTDGEIEIVFDNDEAPVSLPKH